MPARSSLATWLGPPDRPAKSEDGQMASPSTIWTIGHSNRSIQDFLEALADHAIRLVADVRRYPGSRKHPQFNGANLEGSLREAGIGYRHFPDLGGRRSKRAEGSPNTAWRVEAFNAYADYMRTAEFRQALADLEAEARKAPTAIMCAEALPWRCHRRLIADALVARDWTVLDIFSVGKARRHELPEFAKVVQGMVTYPGESSL